VIVLCVMKKELSQKEREEVVTKGFLVDYLDKKEYITRPVLEEILEKKLEPYVTKDYLDKRMKEQSADFRQHLDSLIEHHMNQLQIFMESMDERYVLRREWNMSK